MDAITLLDVLYQIEKIGEIKINRTAGLDIIRLLHQTSFQQCVETYYQSISEQEMKQ